LRAGEGTLDEDDDGSWEPLKEGGGRYNADQQEGYASSSHDVMLRVMTSEGWYGRYSGTSGGDKKIGSKTRKGYHDDIVELICKEVGVYRKHKSIGTQITKMVGDFREAHLIASKTGAGEIRRP